jgi:hypothetical protein
MTLMIKYPAPVMIAKNNRISKRSTIRSLIFGRIQKSELSRALYTIALDV